MTAFNVYIWKKAPAIRLLIPFAAGIIIQWQAQLPLIASIILSLFCSVIIGLYSYLPVTKKWRYAAVNGVAVNLLCAAIGAILIYLKDIRHQPNWIGTKNNTNWLITLQEPLVEKPNSYKAIATVEAAVSPHKLDKANGRIIVYFKKDTAVQKLGYGSTLVIHKPLQPITNSGNPGSFNYRQYCLFQGITHQVYMAPEEYVVLPQKRINAFKNFVFQSRKTIVQILRTYIPGERERGLAEALLIGYKDDLDKSLVQTYSNTGVVHIIAISGLHLGLIYGLLLLLTRPLKRYRKLSGLRVVTIIGSLWLFSILAGAQPSVLRSAVMFSFIALAEVLDRRTSIYNTLALSAFLLLCYNPFWLWDVGFQLSYAAVLSIIIFFRPIYNWIYFTNKALDFIWKLSAVTLAAQIFTLPLSLYHFHQFPTLFLFSNMLAVPLSSIILIGEIVLCAVYFIPVIAKPLGILAGYLLQWMNQYIERIDTLSFATWNGISISLLQALLLTAFIAAISIWLLQKQKAALWWALGCLLLFMALRSISFITAYRQQKLIVYNVPKHQAIDIIHGRQYAFIGDSILWYDDFLRNFHLQPSRILHRIAPEPFSITKPAFQINNKHIALIDTTLYFLDTIPKQNIDVLILSKNPRLYITTLYNRFSIGQIVIDGSVPAWKAKLWKRDCDSLHIPYYDVSEKGAFVMNLE